MDVDLILFLINTLGPASAKLVTAGMDWFARNYLDVLGVVRWLVPCVILFCLLTCLSAQGNTETE